MIVPLCDRVPVDTGFLINDAAEACQRSFLGGCRLIYNVSFVIQRHRRIFRHCCQIKGKAVCLAPVREVLGCFDGRLGGFIGVGDRQVVLLFIILDGCCKSICVRIFGDGHHSSMRIRIIGHAVYSAVLLRDCVGICSCLIIFDLSERCRFIAACCFCSHLLRYRNRADRILIICSIYSAYCFQFEIELIGFSPVIKTLGRLQFCLCSGKCVDDRKALFVIICDRCFKSIGLSILGDADMHTMRCRIIGDTVHIIILLCNRVVIFSGGLIFDLTEDRLHASALCYCNGIARRHGRVFSHGRKLEGEAGCPSPVLNSLRDFKLFLYRSKGVGDCKAVLAIILGKCDQITIVISFYSYYYVVRCCIVGNSRDVVIHFCNSVVISSFPLVFHAAEHCSLMTLCRCRCRFMRRRHRRFPWPSFSIRKAAVSCCQFKSKAFCIAPLIDRLGRLQRKSGGCIPVGDRQGRLVIIGNVCYQVVAFLCLVDIHNNQVLCRIVGDTRYFIIHFCDLVLVLPHSIVFNRSEYCLEISALSDRSACHFSAGFRIFGHRCAIDRSQVEGEAFRASPVIDRLCCLQSSVYLIKFIGDRQAGCVSTIRNSRGQFICFIVLAYHYCYKVLTCIVCDSGHMIICLFNGIHVCAGGFKCDISEYSFCILLCRSRCSAVSCRHRRVSGVLGGKCKCKSFRSAPVVDALGYFDMFFYSLEFIRDYLSICAFCICYSRSQISICPHGNRYCYFLRSSVIRYTGQISLGLCNRIFVCSLCAESNLAK